ncbi:hypothetical protein D5F01_LYC17616 [Larimichthys crocea]|uniref:C-type lectin domain-containing protein n=1 Tax=Larimichthys crocea TaxID=215358 RepID=A0A6G0HYK9_LARCR|nr:hypothetical protein D5F01_LYC17616 [Larimichthys crocea]
MLSLVILLLSSGCVILCSQYEQEYVLIDTSMTWNNAQTYCRENHIDLATIRNRDDMTKLAKTPSDGVSSAWIGLKKNGVASWQWSVGETQTSDGLVNYTNWASSPDSSHDCGGMRDDGKWLSAPCGNLNPFVCQEDKGSSKMYVVLEAMSWRQARAHCQLNYGDLVSVMNVIENQAVQQIAGNFPPTFFWIGVFKDEWKCVSQEAHRECENEVKFNR